MCDVLRACLPRESQLLSLSSQAGLASPENSEQLIIALEPEAASIYCRKLRLHQMIELSGKAVVNGYSASDTVGAGFAQGTSALSLPPSARPPPNPQVSLRLRGSECSLGREGLKPLFPWCFYPAPKKTSP